MQTGENEQSLRKIVDMTRFISLLVLGLHFYYYCYGGLVQWKWNLPLLDKVIPNIERTGLFKSFYLSKLLALAGLVVSLIASRGKKSEKMSFRKAISYLVIGLLIYFIGDLALESSLAIKASVVIYMVSTLVGYIFILTGGTYLSRVIHLNTAEDIFNAESETFPQEERKIENEYSVNLPAVYQYKKKLRSSWINYVNLFRGLLVIGSPGSGKSYFVIQHIIKQHISKGFTVFLYDYKFDDLSIIVYNHYLKNLDKYKVKPAFYVINFDDLTRCHRCNPLHPSGMNDLMDAIESARAILLGLNRDWIKKQGDFFVESPINLVAALIWFLRKYKDGKYCTLPHVIELLRIEYEKLFAILMTEKEIEVLVDPFQSAFKTRTFEQLEGQVAGAKIALGRLSSPTLYYVLSGNDFTLDINDPNAPKLVCAANNPQKQEIYGAVLSLFISRMTRLVNTKGKLPSSLIFDEYPSIYFSLESTIAQARSNLVAVTIAVQDISQVKNLYSKEQAEVIFNICGNMIAGQVSGDTAKLVSERFGKTMQDRQSYSINSNDTSISKSKQLEQAVPPSKIANLSSGEFVGAIADTPSQPVELKTFHSKIINNHDELKKEHDGYKKIPSFRKIDENTVLKNFEKIKGDVNGIVEDVMDEIMNDPFLAHLIPKSMRS